MGDEQLSDDLAQDTFIKAYTNITTFRGLASFKTWVMRIAYNVWYDHTRRGERGEVRSERKDVVQQERMDYSLTSHSSPLTSEIKLDLYAALALLKPDERTCITLQLIDGYDIAGIAKITQMKEGTIKSHLSRGKEKLANYLRQNGYDQEASQQQIADNGFTERVMQHLPQHSLLAAHRRWLTRLWTMFCIVVFAILFVLFDGWTLLAIQLEVLVRTMAVQTISINLLMVATILLGLLFVGVGEVISSETVRR